MRDDFEDGKPCEPVELSTERPDTLPPDTEPSGPPGQAAVMAQTLAELLTAVMALPSMLRQDMANGREADRAHLKQELAALHVLMSADIDAARDEVIDKTNAHFAALDRKLEQHLTKIAGHVDSLATIVHVHSHSLDRAHQRLDELEPDQDQHAHNGNGNGNGNGAD